MNLEILKIVGNVIKLNTSMQSVKYKNQLKYALGRKKLQQKLFCSWNLSKIGKILVILGRRKIQIVCKRHKKHSSKTSRKFKFYSGENRVRLVADSQNFLDLI